MDLLELAERQTHRFIWRMSMRLNLDRFAARLGTCLIRYAARKSNIVSFARNELAIAFPVDDGMQSAMNSDVLDIVCLFSTQGHSGMSAGYARGLADKLLGYEPISPLTGEESEWMPLGYSDDMTAQNRRCGHVFRRKDGTAYDSTGRVFREPDGACYTSGDSRVDIAFPYTPTREYVDAAALRSRAQEGV